MNTETAAVPPDWWIAIGFSGKGGRIVMGGPLPLPPEPSTPDD